MALSEQDVQDILTRFDGGEDVAPLATAFGVSGSSIRYHLKKHGRLDRPETESDDDLGIDQEASSADAVSAMLADPKFAALVEQAVAARLSQIGTAAPASGENSVVVAALKELSKSFERSLEIQASQQPGYTKPIPREEVERRAAGYVEMCALIEEYKAAGKVPVYILGEEGFHGPSANGPTLYEGGSEIGCLLAPAESFTPVNAEAKKVYAAMLQWIGGPSPEIGDRIIEAHADAKRVVIGGEEPVAPTSAVTLRAPPKQDVDPLRKHPQAHMLQENPNNLPGAPGARQAHRPPAGPQFVG